MNGKPIVRNAISALGYIITFFGLRVYIGKWVDMYPFLFLIGGFLLFLFAKQATDLIYKDKTP